jgi:hypothetical protein
VGDAGFHVHQVGVDVAEDIYDQIFVLGLIVQTDPGLDVGAGLLVQDLADLQLSKLFVFQNFCFARSQIVELSEEALVCCDVSHLAVVSSGLVYVHVFEVERSVIIIFLWLGSKPFLALVFEDGEKDSKPHFVFLRREVKPHRSLWDQVRKEDRAKELSNVTIYDLT